ncbi:hypothetical protein B0T21DRAFT_375201 [Apiosordaria backusii]|uniref:NAD(P)-binding domain-containing protein n=1 Tax=Apiosordaria backusii TaxID=314023 RepID=A0AA40AIT4_9PEZI|nr:hypothetical protein B0T21DRAFT_375201 [Apiosordaria backusii]
MKLIVAGSTGFVATEIIRQSLSNPSITSIVALGRKPAPTPVASTLLPNADLSKLKSVTLDNFDTTDYPDNVKSELANADACIWTIAITPSQLKSTPWETTVKVCRDYAVNGIKAISSLTEKKPFRFVYISGSNAVRDPAKKPLLLGDYCVLRGEAENQILEFAKNSGGKVEVAIAKPGIISGPTKETGALAKVFFGIIGIGKVRVGQIAGALVEGVTKGFEKETYENADLVRIGGKVAAAKE